MKTKIGISFIVAVVFPCAASAIWLIAPPHDQTSSHVFGVHCDDTLAQNEIDICIGTSLELFIMTVDMDTLEDPDTTYDGDQYGVKEVEFWWDVGQDCGIGEQFGFTWSWMSGDYTYDATGEYTVHVIARDNAQLANDPDVNRYFDVRVHEVKDITDSCGVFTPENRTVVGCTEEITLTVELAPGGGEIPKCLKWYVNGTAYVTGEATLVLSPSTSGDFQYDGTQENDLTVEVVCGDSVMDATVIVGMPETESTMTYSRHPLFSSNDIDPGAFLNGAALMRSDDDGPGTGDECDDVCIDVAFSLNESSTPTFTGDYEDEKYWHLQNWDDLLALYGQPFGNVLYIWWITITYGQATLSGAGWADESNPPKIILSVSASGGTAVHEWLHTVGLSHREGCQPKPIMSDTSGGTAINRSERNEIVGD